jgi:hypothetical protein
MNSLISILASAACLVSLWQLSKKEPAGFVWGAVGQILWLAYAIDPFQPQLVPMGVILLVLNMRGYVKWAGSLHGHSAPLSTETTLTGVNTSMPELASVGSAVGSTGYPTFNSRVLTLVDPVSQYIQDEEGKTVGQIINYGRGHYDVVPYKSNLMFSFIGSRNELIEEINRRRDEF